jgi:hypothetical protein
VDRKIPHPGATCISHVLGGVSMTDALAALRAYAYTRGRRLTDVSADVIERKVRLLPGSPSVNDDQEE